MTKKSRFELGHLEKTRRSIYVFLRDQLEHKLISIALESPYRLCRVKDMPYPYVEPGDLKPKKKEFTKDSFVAQPFFIVFCEDAIDEVHQKYIRFSESNRVKKTTSSSYRTSGSSAPSTRRPGSSSAIRSSSS